MIAVRVLTCDKKHSLEGLEGLYYIKYMKAEGGGPVEVGLEIIFESLDRAESRTPRRDLK